MLDKFRRKLAKIIAPKPKKRAKKLVIKDGELGYAQYIEARRAVERIINDKSYRENKRNKQAEMLIGE